MQYDWNNDDRRRVANLALRAYVKAKRESFKEEDFCDNTRDLIADLLHLIARRTSFNEAYTEHRIAWDNFAVEHENPEEEA